MNIQNPPVVKLLLLGDSSVGKTSFIQRHITGNYPVDYTPTDKVNVSELLFNTTRGYIKFILWECPGNLSNADLDEAYYIRGQCAIIMFDKTSRGSFNNISYYMKKIKNICGDIPVVVCGNKSEYSPKKVVIGDPYVEISVENNYQLNKPFLLLAKRLFNDTELIFI